MQNRSEAPGPPVAPSDVKVGEEYYFKWGRAPLTKGKVTKIEVIPFPLNANGWRNRVMYTFKREGQEDFLMFVNPETPETHAHGIFKKINPIFERRKSILMSRDSTQKQESNSAGGRRRRRRKTRKN